MKKIAFTLAEVLITLTILGVIAALTIPNLMQKWSDHADVVKVKEAYSILNNAYKMLVAENGPISEWSVPEDKTNKERALYVAQLFSKYLKVSNFCGISNGKGVCSYYAYNGTGTGTGQFMQGLKGGGGQDVAASRLDTARLQLKNGMLVGFQEPGVMYDDLYASVYVDINGRKKPNRMGYDVFIFYFWDAQGSFRSGGYGFYITAFDNKSSYCNKYLTDRRDGVSCAYWVIKHGNMDYKYRDVSAEW